MLGAIAVVAAQAVFMGGWLLGHRRQRRVQERLDERLRFEILLSDLAAGFVEIPVHEVDWRIDEALRRTMDELGLDRVGLGELAPGGDEMRVTHISSVAGLTPTPTVFTAEAWPWVWRRLRAGHDLLLARLADLPAEAARDRQSFEALGTKAIVLLPLLVDGAVVGALACSMVRGERGWPSELCRRLRLLADIFAVVLMRRRADRALEASEGRFHELTNAAPVMIWVAGPDGRCSDVNRTWLGFTGRTLAQELGDGWLDSVHPDDRASFISTYRDAIANRRPFSIEYRLRRADGVYRPVLDNGIPRFDGDHGFQGYVGSAVDVTEVKAAQQRRAEDEVRRERDDLAHALRVGTLGELATSLAHEINQPLAAIASNADAVRRMVEASAVDPDVPEALRDIQDSAQRAAQVIRRLRVLFKKEQSEPQPVDLTEVITEVVGLLRNDMERRRVRVELAMLPDPPRVLGDVVQLQQVLLNVFVNAGEAMGGTGHPRELRVEMTAREPTVLSIAVRDTGPSVPVSELEHIFERFVTSKAEGLGMGLSISRSIIRAHGGRMWATRNTDRGLTMHIELPCLDRVHIPEVP